jgi:hypothetical protein
MSDDAFAVACRPARESELLQILALRRRVNPTMWWDDERFVTWRYFSRTTEAGEVPYWVFVRENEVLAGCGLEPVTIVVDGSPMSAVRSLDIMVRPDLDGLGLGALLNMALFRHFAVVLVTGSNERSHALLMRMFQHVTDLRFWKAPLRARAVVDGKASLGVATPIVAAPIDLLLSLRRSIARVAPPPGVTVERMARFDARVADLSRRCERKGRLIVRRSHEYLNWRFVNNPRCAYQVFGAFVGTRLDGYVVTRFNCARPNPRRVAEVVDWLAPAESEAVPSVLPALVQAGVDALHEAGAGIVTCAAATTEGRALETIGFRFRAAERIPFFVKAADPSLHGRLSMGDDWFLTRLDYDVE